MPPLREDQGQNLSPEQGEMERYHADQSLDCFGLLCPLPIIETAKKIKKMKPGEVLEVISTDEGIKEDLPAWCRQTGQIYLGRKEEKDLIKAYVKKVKG